MGQNFKSKNEVIEEKVDIVINLAILLLEICTKEEFWP